MQKYELILGITKHYNKYEISMHLYNTEKNEYFFKIKDIDGEYIKFVSKKVATKWIKKHA